jgi:hypothetical protein
MIIYKPSPKPNFNKPTHIKYDLIETHMWGDEISGKVKDWIYVSNKSLHQIIFGMESKCNFKHSDQYRTIFGADELMYVLSGVLIINNPETGETQKVNKGESVFFRKDTWHHAFNYSDEYLQVLEFFSPPPLTGTSGLYAKEKKLLENNIYKKKNFDSLSDFKNQNTFKIIKKDDLVWSLEGPQQEILIGTFISTKFLKVHVIKLLPNQKTHNFKFLKNTTFLSLNNNIKVNIIERNREFILNEKDGMYLPDNTNFIIENMNDYESSLIYCEGL